MIVENIRTIMHTIKRKLVSLLERIHAYSGMLIGKCPESSLASEVRQVKQIMPRPRLIIDVGANIGEYTAECLKVFGPNTEVHIFEPSKTNINSLETKFSDNKQVFVNPVGLSNTTGTSKLYSNVPGSDLGSLTQRKLSHVDLNFDCVEEVELIRFDDYYAHHLQDRTIDFMKIDVEGHELDVLSGLGNLFTKIACYQFEFGGCNIDTRTFYIDFYTLFKDHFTLKRMSPLGPIDITTYREEDEYFKTTNFLALRKDLSKSL